MAIKAERFKFLDKETNVPTLDFINIKDSDVYNAAKSGISDIGDSIKDFIKIPKLEDVVKEAEDLNKELTRISKDATGVLKDISGLSTKDIDNILVDMFPDSSITRSIASQMTDKCKTKALGNEPLGKPYDPTINCNGKDKSAGTNSCNASQFSSILDKLTDGGYQSSYKDINNALKTLISLTKLGYDFNMCGVFSALSNMVSNKDILGKAAGNIIGYLAAAKDTLGLLDMSSSTTELDVKNGAGYLFNNFSLPKNTKERDYADLANRICEASDAFDNNWSSSYLDNILSIAIITEYNKELDKIMASKKLNHIYDSNHLNEIPQDDCDFISVAYKIKRESNIVRA